MKFSFLDLPIWPGILKRTMAIYSNKAIAQLLREVATAYSLTGANRFRTIAYQRAADVIEQLSQELYDLYRDGRDLSTVTGVGVALAGHLKNLFEGSKDDYLHAQRGLIPVTVYELMKLPGVGPKNAYKLAITFNLTNLDTAIDDLEKHAVAGQIAVLEGFGKKSEADIIEAIRVHRERKNLPERVLLHKAHHEAELIRSYLLKHAKITHVEALGSLRRWEQTIGDIDLIAVCPEEASEDVIDYFTKYPSTMSIDSTGPKKGAIITTKGMRVDLRTVRGDEVGAMLQYFTGSKEHNIRLREYGLKKGYSLNEWGIKDVKTGEVKTFATEEDFYGFLGLQYIPPELRQGKNEIALAQKRQIPTLVTLEDIKGDFHMHSSYEIESSHDIGADDAVEMLIIAEKLGYDYIAFADHNPSVGNHSEAEIVTIMKNRFNFYREVTKKNRGCHSLISLEVDIQPDGSLALPEAAFKYVDFLVVSIHSSFSQSKEDMTKRILKALSYPKVKIMGHPTGRMIGKRDSIDADWDAIFTHCVKHQIAMEINASPERLDLPELLVRRAADTGCHFSIDTDSHAAAHLPSMLYGVSVARRAGLTKDRIINAWRLETVKKFLLE
ncbi:MAG: DNA polymerase/3'-5' exonuclease PolX [Microgenomates bacterium OLB22]|nr:MAG: DNA polymerase/3'-5' exonuclease PolX [Microgenomates bacterium OLB22]